MAETSPSLEPNRADMARHLELLFAHATEYDDGLIEIAINTGKGWQGQLFATDDIDGAVAFAASRNEAGCNAYVGVALRDPDTPPMGRASDTDHYATTAVGGDLDTAQASAQAAERTRHLPPTFVVCTGQHPHMRLQPFWRLTEAVTDPEQHRALFGGIADMLDGDRVITNPSRIMRLAGSIAWPTKEGRIPELTYLLPVKDERRAYSAEAIAKAYPIQHKVHALDATHKNDPIERVGAKNSLGLDTGRLEDGREDYLRRTLFAVLMEYVGTHGAAPTEQELFDLVWPQYERGVVTQGPGLKPRGQADVAAKCRSTLRRFEQRGLTDGHGKRLGLEDMVAAYQEKRARMAAEQEAPKDKVKAEKPVTKIRTSSFLDLLTDETPDEPDYIEPNFLGPGMFGLIAGPPKAQKSFLLTEILVACATGSTFLSGRYTVPRPLKVFYLQAEMGRKLLKKRAQMMTFLPPEQKALLGQNLVVTERFHMLLDEAGVQLAAETIKGVFPDGPDIIAIDPLANLFDGESEDKAPEIMAFLTQRVEVLRRAVNPAAAVIMVHHSAKKNSEDMNRDPFVAIRGSGALRGYYDTGVIIYRKSEEAPERKVFIECRNGESPDPITVRLTERGTFEVQDTSVAGVSPSTAEIILGEIRSAWNARRPLSTAPQTRKEGRHVGRCIAAKHGMAAEAVESLVEQWLMNGVVAIEMVNTDSKMKGLKVIGTINTEV